MFGTLIRRYPVQVFCVATILLSFAAYLLPIPREVVPFIMVLIPTGVALVCAAVEAGGAGVRALLGKLSFSKLSLRWILVAVAIAAAMRLTVSLAALLLGWIPAIQIRPVPVGGVLALALIFILAGLLEELGWRGFALPHMLDRTSPLVSALVLGAAWGVIHFALHLPGMPSAGEPLLATLIALTGLSVILTWLFIESGGSVLLTTLFHAAQSFFVIFNEGVTLRQQIWLMAAVWAITALIVVLTRRSIRAQARLKLPVQPSLG